jgi:hypothetical protein
MTDLLKLLKEVIGVRPLVPVVLIVLLGLAFKSVREYPIRELVQDRWFLAIGVGIVAVSVIHAVLTSGLADRTPDGRIGVYVARFKGDPANAVRLNFLEGLRGNLEMKSRDSKTRIEVRELDEDLAKDEGSRISAFAPQINASVVIWGTAVDEKSFYPRLWSTRGGVTSLPRPVDVKNLESLAEYSSFVWARIAELPTSTKHQNDTAESLRKDFDRLQRQVTELTAQLGAVLPRQSANQTAAPTHTIAVLAGVDDYESSPLRGPANDVRALAAALQERNPGVSTTILLNKAVTRIALEEAATHAAATLKADEPLILYFSGHTGKSDKGQSVFFLSNLEQLVLADFVRGVVKRHARTVIIVDGGFDLAEIPKAEVPEGAVLSADPSGQGYATERIVGDRYMGAFTSTLVRAISTSPKGLGLSSLDLFAMVSALMKSEQIEPMPAVLAGANAPVL